MTPEELERLFRMMTIEAAYQNPQRDHVFRWWISGDSIYIEDDTTNETLFVLHLNLETTVTYSLHRE